MPPGPSSIVADGWLPARLATRAAAAAATPEATVAAAAAAAAPAESSAATTTPLLRPRLVHAQASSFELPLIERLTCGLPLLIVRHFDEREAPRASRCVVANQVHRIDLAVAREELLELRLLGVI